MFCKLIKNVIINVILADFLQTLWLKRCWTEAEWRWPLPSDFGKRGQRPVLEGPTKSKQMRSWAAPLNKVFQRESENVWFFFFPSAGKNSNSWVDVPPTQPSTTQAVSSSLPLLLLIFPLKTNNHTALLSLKLKDFSPFAFINRRRTGTDWLFSNPPPPTHSMDSSCTFTACSLITVGSADWQTQTEEQKSSISWWKFTTMCYCCESVTNG